MAARWHKPGTRINAKFPGKDSKTGKAISVGDTIECDSTGRGWFVVTKEYRTEPDTKPEPTDNRINTPFVHSVPTESKSTGKGIVTTIKFKDFSEFLLACERKPLPGLDEIGSERIEKRSRDRFHYYDTWKDAQNGALFGDEKLQKMVEALSAEIKHGMGHAERRVQRVRSIAGGYASISAYLSGDPENMYRYKAAVRQGGKIISIHVSAGANCNIDVKNMALRGAAVMALTEILTEAGYDVEVYVSSIAAQISNRHIGNTRMEVLVPVKRAIDRFDMARMVYALVSPDMLRRNFFRINETESSYTVREYANQAHGNSDGMGKFMPQLFPADIYVHSDTEDWHKFSTSEKARSWVEGQIIMQGIAYPAK